MKCLRKMISFFVFILFSFSSMAVVVKDNDGAAFITKTEFDSLRNDFQSKINEYNTSLDNKIDAAIASYLAGIKLPSRSDITTVFYGKTVMSYGLSNEIMFKAGRSSFSGLYVTGNAHTNYYTSTYGYVDFSADKIDGVYKVVKRKVNTSSSSTQYATEWLGTSKDLEMVYNGYMYQYDESGNSKRWYEYLVEAGDNILILPPASWQATSLTADTVSLGVHNNSATYTTKAPIYNGSWILVFGDSSNPSSYNTWGQSPFVSLTSSNGTFYEMNYGTLVNKNIILTNNNMAEDSFFNNTEDMYSYNNYNEMPEYMNNTSVSKTLIDADVSKGRILPVTTENYDDINIDVIRSARSETGIIDASHNTIGKYTHIANKHSLDVGTATKFSSWPFAYWSSSYYYYFWPQKGWDPKVKYEQLYCSELQDEDLTNTYASSPMIKTAEIDSKKKLTAYAGLALVNVNQNIIKLQIPIKFTDNNEYDMWIKWGPFTNKENPKLETNLFENMVVNSPHSIDSTTKGIKVKTGDTVELDITNNAKGYIFIKWSKHQTDTSKIGTGGGAFIVPNSVQITKPA